MSYEPFCRCGNPHQVKKLTTRWPDCRHDINYSSENWPQKKKKKKKKGNKSTLELKSNCTSNNQDDAGQVTDDPFQDVCQELNMLFLSVAHWLLEGGAGLWTVLSPSMAASIQNKAHFLAFWAASSQTLLSVTLWGLQNRSDTSHTMLIPVTH